MYYDDYDDEDGARRRKWFVAAGVVVLLAALAFWQLRRGSDSNDATAPQPAATSVSVIGTVTNVTEPNSTEPNSTVPDSAVQGSNVPDSNAPNSSAPDSAVAATTASIGDLEDDSTSSAIPRAPATTDAGPATTASPTTVPGAPQLGYPTSPDGTPLPAVVIFDTETITISGQVPSQAAKDRLGALAIANSQFPDAELIDNMVINPAVPISVGVRVIELNSARFPEGTAQIRAEHARELDRVVTIMQALPNISVLVVGHSDQRGDDLKNFAISDERARAVVNYLLYLGISPTRLASRAAGETDLLTLGDDDSALALNRRTEFIFYGLLVE